MKLHLLSDLHIDSYAKQDLPRGEIPDVGGDLILLAGDISNSVTGLEWAIEQGNAIDRPILYVPGNHEYYHENIDELDYRMQLMTKDTNVYFLQMDSIDFFDVRILGCTLWTDFCYGGSSIVNMEKAKQEMRDYGVIRAGQGMFTPEKAAELHQQHREWLQRALKQAHLENKRTVVISHHGVTPQSISAKYRPKANNAAFMSDLSTWLEQPWAPILWLHGHTHEAFDYVYGNTRVVVNPRAYPAEISTTQVAFDWKKCIDV